MSTLPNLFPACYFPPVTWFVAAIREEQVYVDTQQSYRKQRLSSRTHIRVSNRVMPLTIPVKRRSSQAPLSHKEISYAERWQHQHWQSLVSAYRASPYFEYYEPYLAPLYTEKPVYTEKPDRLMDFLANTMRLSCKWAGIEVAFYSGEQVNEATKDFRQAFDPGRKSFPDWYSLSPYPQVFEGFEPGLSILDLVCNLGPESSRYLLQSFIQKEEKEVS